MNKKIILKLLITAVLVASLSSGCSLLPQSSSPSPQETEPSGEAPSESPSETAPSGEESPSPKVTVHVFQYKPEYKDAFTVILKDFSEANKEVSLIVESLEPDKEYPEALKARFSSGQEPDLFNIAGPQDIALWKDKLLDLSQIEASQYAIEDLLKDVTQEGKIYGLPVSVEGYGLVYNTEIFTKAQIDIKEIDSFQALEIAVKKLDDQKKDLKIEAVFAFPAKENVETGLYLSNLFISAEFEGDAKKTYEAKTISFKYGEAFKKMVDLQNRYSVQPSAQIDYQTQIEKLFAEEKVAMIQQGSWLSATLQNSDKDFAKKVGFLPYPVEGYKKEASPIGVPMYWAINQSVREDVRQGAEDFINWLYLSEGGHKAISEQFKFIPAYKGFAADTVGDPLGKYILSQISAGNNINWVFKSYPEDWGLKTLGPDINLYVQGKLTWDQVIKNARDSWEQKRK